MCQKIKNFFGKWRQMRQKLPLPEIVEQLKGISEEKSLYRYAPGKWSIRSNYHLWVSYQVRDQAAEGARGAGDGEADQDAPRKSVKRLRIGKGGEGHSAFNGSLR